MLPNILNSISLDEHFVKKKNQWSTNDTEIFKECYEVSKANPTLSSEWFRAGRIASQWIRTLSPYTLRLKRASSTIV